MSSLSDDFGVCLVVSAAASLVAHCPVMGHKMTKTAKKTINHCPKVGHSQAVNRPSLLKTWMCWRPLSTAYAI